MRANLIAETKRWLTLNFGSDEDRWILKASLIAETKLIAIVIAGREAMRIAG